MNDPTKMVYRSTKKPYSRILCGKIDNRLAERIKADTGINLLNYNVAITSEYENKHIDPEKEAKQGMVAMSPDMVALLPDIITNYDKVEYAGYNKQQQQVLRFEKNINGRKVAVEYVSKGRKTIDLQTMYGWENKKEKNSHQASHANAHDRTFKTDLDMSSSTNSISKNGENTTKRFSLSENVKAAEELFAEEYDAWDKTNPTKVFKVSVTSKALKEIGIDDKSITMDSSKIIKIRSKHKGMTDAVIKKIPRVINEPMLILESKTAPSRVVMLGELVDEDGKTVLVVLELNPTNRKGIALDEIKITSAYGKDNLQNFVNASKILYVNPDNTKTSSWLTSTRLQLPVESLTTGSTDSIASTNSVVKNDLRYSLNDATDLNDFWFNNDNLEEPIGNAASILEEGAKLLQGKAVDTDTIRKIARGMVKEYQSHYDVDTLSENLEKLFSYMQTQDKVSYDDMIRIMTEITMPVIEESTSIDETQQEIYQNFKKKLRGMNISLSQQQKDEMAHYYDSYENLRRKMFGTLPLSESGIRLEELWFEISKLNDPTKMVYRSTMSVGNEWLKSIEYNEKTIRSGDTITAPLSSGITITGTVIESDSVPDYGSGSVRLSLDRGEKTTEIYARENRGRYSGNFVIWELCCSAELIERV